MSQALHQNWNQFGALTPEKANGIATFPGSMEVQAHFAAGDDQAGLDLIRLEWGYMLNNATSTMSTFWEGYMADGTFLVFDFPYGLRGQLMSHAHGWATGPTSALTFYVLGLGQDASGGSTYQMVPHPGDLTHAEGQLALPFGPVAAWWTRDQARGTFIESVQTSDNVYGRIGVPTFGRDITVYVDGSMVWNSCNPATNNNARRDLFDSGSDNAYFYLDGMRGGHIVTSMAISCAGGSIT